MTRILGHIGEIPNYRILHRIFWWRMSLPPLFLLSVVNADLWGFFSDPVFYFGTVTDAGLVRPQGHLFLVEISLITVEIFVLLGLFVLRYPWIVWPTRGLVGQFCLVELSLRVVWGLWMP